MRSAVILFVLTRCAGLLADGITTGAPSTVSDFVDELKQDLRRNNDDYVESTAIPVKVTNPYLQDITKDAKNVTKSSQTLAKQDNFYYRREPSNKNKLLSDTKTNGTVKRRLLDSMEYKIEEGKPIADITPINSIAPTLLTRKLKETKPRAWQRSTTPKALTNNMKIINTTALNLLGKHHHPNQQNKKNRLKTFIGKNKQLFQDFLHKKQLEAQKQKEAQEEKVKLRWKIDDTEASDDKSEQVRKKAARQRASSLESGVLKAELLDMAPAKGGQLHHQRIKGRLCQRHVLIPEGPKYNSRGEMYVPAYGHRAGRDYVHSPRPKFVLPRCCNCCRKSLLGCE